MMKMRSILSAVVMMAVVVFSVNGCGGGGDGGGGTNDSSEFDVKTPTVSKVIIDEDPHSPIAATVMFEDGDHQIERLDYFGPKFSTGNPPSSALVYMKESEHTFRIDFDSEGRMSTLYLGELGKLQFDFDSTAMNLDYIAPDGSVSSKRVELESADTGRFQKQQEQTKTAAATDIHAAGELSALVEINRAVYVDVTVGTDSGPLPSNFAVPTLNQIACWGVEFDPDAINYDCRAVAPLLIESGETHRTYRLVMLHRASGYVSGVEPAVWPSLEACQDAINGDFWVYAGLTAGLEVTANTIGVHLLPWLKAEVAAAGAAAPAVGVILFEGAAIAATTAGSYWIGGWVHSKVSGTPQDCENIGKRVVAESTLGLGAARQEFTNAVHMDDTFGWTLDSKRKAIGPYRPFSSEMATTPGDAGSLDNNSLPGVDFVATKSEVADNWHYWPFPEHCPTEYSGDSQYLNIDISENMRAVCTYSSVDTLSIEDIYVDGKRCGWYKNYFYYDGQVRLVLQRPYSENGKANGLTSEYHLSNGSLSLQYTFVDDVLNGEYKRFSEDGDLVKCDIYENDQVVGSCMP
jgi:hypothetical protein